MAQTLPSEVTTVAWYRLGEDGSAGANTSPGGTALTPFGYITSTVDVPDANNTPIATSSVSQTFDGVSGSLVALPGVLASLQPDNLGIEAWVRSADSSRNSIIAHNGMSSASLGVRGFGLLQTDGKYCGHLAGLPLVGASPVEAGVWTHLALVRQDGIWQFYVNGILNASVETAQNNVSPELDSFSIGSDPSREGGFFSGQIDEVRVFTFAPGRFYSGDLNYFSSSVPPWISPYNWSATAERSPGLRYTQVTLTSPRLNVVNVLKVDLNEPTLRLSTTGRHPDWGQVMPTFNQYTIRTGRQTTLNYLSSSRSAGVNMVAAINAAPWLPWPELNSFNYNIFRYADRLGLAVSNGVVVSDQENSAHASPSLVIGEDRTARIFANKSMVVDTAYVLTAISGFDMILSRGVAGGSGSEDLHPRTALGLSYDQSQVILMTVDGRRTGHSLGAGTKEVGELLRHFGAWSGINLDGGGSTTMALYDTGNNTLSVANRPSSTERANGNNLGVYYIPNPEQVPKTDSQR